MARFFANLNNENNRIDEKKAEKYFNEINSTEIVSKKDKKYKEIENKATELMSEKNPKIFDKNFKKFIQDLKKFSTKNNSIPTVVDDLFSIVKSTQGLNLINEFKKIQNNTFETNINTIEHCLKNNKKTKSLDEILEIENDEERLIQLEALPETSDTLIPQYFLCNKKNDYNKMLNILKKLYSYTDSKAIYFKKNIDKYIDKILMECNDNQINYNELLPILNMYNLKNEELYVKLIKMNQIDSKVDSVLFLPVWYIKTNEVHKAIEIIDIPFLNQNKDNWCIKYIYIYCAKKFFEINEFQKAFEIYNIFNDEFILENQILCILLHNTENELFKNFINEFKSFEKNPFLLISEDNKMEMFRGFYYISNNCRIKGIEILKSIIK